MLCLIVIAHSYAVGSQRHVLLPSRKSPLSLTATGELGGHGQWNPGQRLVRSAQNWAFCPLFISPGSPLTKALGLMFYCCSDRPALQPSACVQSYRWTLSVFHSLTEGEDHIVLLAALEYLIMFSSVNACVHTSVSAHRFMKDDQMTRWAVINELSTEHFWPSGKRVPWWSWPVSGHRGWGAPAQRALCLCQDSPKESCTGPAHLDSTRLRTALHLSVLTQKSHDNIINLPQCFNILIIISNYPTIHLDSAVQCPKPAINRRNIDAGYVFSVL